MKKLGYKIVIATAIIFSIALSSCIHKDFEEPKFDPIPEGDVLTLDQLFSKYEDSLPYKFKKDISIYAVVNMDDKSGNIYKSAYIQDNFAGINLRLLASGGLYQGDSIRLNLKGTVLNKYRQMWQIDSVHVDNNITKIATGKHVTPEVVAIGQITDYHLGRLIKLEGVEFTSTEVGQIFANPEVSENHTLQNCNGNQIVVRTSGYANFASEKIPGGRGSLIAVVGKYDDTKQLYIRSMSEVNLTGRRCGEPFFSEDFSGIVNNEPINIEGWKNISQIGNIKWVGLTLNNGSEYLAKIQNEGEQTTTWLILPKLSFEDSFLKFRTRALGLAGSKLAVMVSTNYDGGNNPENATWTELPATIATGATFTDSGNLSLANYSGQDIYIAFKFTGATGCSGYFHLDDITVFNDD